MLIGFSVSNFKSFRDPQNISFVASKIVRHKDHVAEVGNRKILKSGLIFGANAGGKSNLIQAIAFSSGIVIKGLDKSNLSKKYFRIDANYYQKPGVFEYRILVNEKEYSYGLAITYDTQEIVSEWLYRIERPGKEVCIFNRNINDIGISEVETDIKRASQKDSARLSIYFEDFGENISDLFRQKTILADIATRGNGKTGIFKEIFDVYRWFGKLLIIFPDTKYSLLNELGSNRDRKEFFQNIMNYFDTGIEAIESQSTAMDFDKLFEDIPRSTAEKIKTDLYNQTKDHEVTLRLNDQFVVLHRDENGNVVYNKLFLNHGNKDDKFEYSDESDGTKRLFDLVPLLYDESQNDRVILIDEIDRSLHTKLAQKFIELFYGKTAGNNCQLIATTHDSNLLDLEILRQDEIWFVKRNEDHSSEVFSLNKYKERFDKKIDKEYLLGRYGAIPIFDDTLLLEDSDDE